MCQKTQGLMFQIGLSSYFAKTMKQVFPEPPDGRIIVFTGSQIKRVIQITSEKCVGAMVGCVILNFGKKRVERTTPFFMKTRITVAGLCNAHLTMRRRADLR